MAFFEKKGIEFVNEPLFAKSNFWLNAILLRNEDERDSFLKYANENGIMVRPAWRLINKLEMYRNCQKGDLYNAEYFEKTVVNIPSSIRNNNI
jgi:dTDP-4-amino-4,6-dideoxygalactose transaminase